MKERTCVFWFVERSQKAFNEGTSLRSVLSTVPHHKDVIRRAYGPMPKNFFVHNLATSTLGLRSLATYEFLRHKGLPLPDANDAIQVILPCKKSIAYLFSGERDIADSRPEKIAITDEQNMAQEMK